MDGGGGSSGLYRQSTEAAQGQILDENVGSGGLENQCGLVQKMDDSQLFGVPLAVAGEPATVAKGGEQAAAPALEINPATVGIVGQVVEKKKRGRPPKGQGQAPRPPPPKKNRQEEEEEDVCFICFDGGSLVLCDRKGCPKAYHPACIKRDEAFFRSKAKWNCGWHICSVCQKAAHYMCYTCTYSLCKGCTKEADYVCVRGNKGFCTTCMKTIMLIENKDMGNNESVRVDFDDKTSWEYLFKVYWVFLKGKLALTLDELTEAKNPWKMLATDIKVQSPDNNNYFAKAGVGQTLDKSLAEVELKMPKTQPEVTNQNNQCSDKLSNGLSTTSNGCTEWASKELLEFVGHIRNGDTSVISQFDVQALLLEYIKINNLRDPCRKSQIVCDLRLKNLFRKPRVGHIEMLKLLDYHFLIKEDTQRNAFIPAGIVAGMSNHVGIEQNNDLNSNQSKKRRTRKKGEERAPHANLDEFAAIDVHNINLIYLRRKLMESLLGELEKFHDKVVGSIVRIRVSNSDQKQDIYRLVQVVDTSKAVEPYKVGDNTVDVMLEVLNLDKKETVSIDVISNQEFSEDECRRLRQSIKCGLVKRSTVGEIQIKAIALQAVRLNDWFEAEILRLNHLRDRANEKGHKKELRECVEKLQLLKTPEERQRRLAEIPEVHADPKMNPNYESEDEDKKKDELVSSRYCTPNINGSQRLGPKRKVKDDGTMKSERFNERKDSRGLTNSANQENQVIVCGLAKIWSNQAELRSASEAATTTSSSGDLPPTDDNEMGKIWHYRDPNGKIQGPFSMVQLRKWSTTGYFPDDMRIWANNEQDESVLLTNALNGQQVPVGWHVSDFVSTDSSKLVVDKEQVGSAQQFDLSRNNSSESDRPPQCSTHNLLDLEKTVVASVLPSSGHETMEFNCVLERGTESSHEKLMHQTSGNRSPEIQKPSSSHISVDHQPLGQSYRSVPLDLDLNQNESNSSVVSLTRTFDSSEQIGGEELQDLPSPTPKTSIGHLEGVAAGKLEPLSVDVPALALGVSDLPSPTPKRMVEDLPSPKPNLSTAGLPTSSSKPIDEDQGGQIAETRQSMPPKVPIQDSCPSWSKASSLSNGGPQLREIGGEWGGYSSTHAKQSIEEWDPSFLSMSSLKQPESVSHPVATHISNSDQLPRSSPSHPASNVSGWQAVNERIEFSTLAEESVSDLLAEVDAMESGFASPTSAMKYSDERNDCFSSIEELSPTPDAGKSDALSSPTDIQFPSQETVIDDPVGAPRSDAFENLKRSGGHSTTSSEGEAKSADALVNPREGEPSIYPLVPCAVSQGMPTSPMGRGRVSDVMDPNWAAVQGNMNLGWGGPSQGFANVGWGSNVGAPWANPNFNLGAYNGNAAWDNQRRYGGERFAGSRDWAFQGGDHGFGRGRPTWSRQSHGGGGGYSRAPPKGQRVCKFYESGHCKKGASCDYFHP